MKLPIGDVGFAVKGLFYGRWTVVKLSGDVRVAALRAFYWKRYDDLGFQAGNGRLTPYKEGGHGVILHEDVNWDTAGERVTA